MKQFFRNNKINFFGALATLNSKQKGKPLSRRGFTLVELIVVIAIMAVLAGTVAGVTVSIMNKKIDQVNYDIQGKAIASRVVEWSNDVIQSPSYFFELTGMAFQEGLPESDEQWETYAQAAYDVLRREFSNLNWKDTYGLPDKKGQFCADIINNAIYITYKGKSKEYGEVYYKIFINDGGNIVIDKGKTFP